MVMGQNENNFFTNCSVAPNQDLNFFSNVDYSQFATHDAFAWYFTLVKRGFQQGQIMGCWVLRLRGFRANFC